MIGNSKTQHQNVLTHNRVIKNTMIHQPKVDLLERLKNWEREREREINNIFFFWWEKYKYNGRNSDKFIIKWWDKNG